MKGKLDMKQCAKTVWFLTAIIMALTSAFILTSCKEMDSLAGSWRYTGKTTNDVITKITFDGQGTGTLYSADATYQFTYAINKNTIKLAITYSSEDTVVKNGDYYLSDSGLDIEWYDGKSWSFEKIGDHTKQSAPKDNNKINNKVNNKDVVGIWKASGYIMGTNADNNDVRLTLLSDGTGSFTLRNNTNEIKYSCKNGVLEMTFYFSNSTQSYYGKCGLKNGESNYKLLITWENGESWEFRKMSK